MIELSVVMPVFNEADAIETSIREHYEAIVRSFAPGDAELLVVDDHSTDATPHILDRLATELDGLRIFHRVSNSGHGPAVIYGIDQADGEWIVHVDSDNQTVPAEFELLWSMRTQADLVLGVRSVRHDPRHRLVITRLTRFGVSRLAGRKILDANVPFKLFRRELWDDLRPYIDPASFAPSLMLAVGAARRGRPIAEVEITHRPRTTGQTTLRPIRLLRAGVRSAKETMAFRRDLRHVSRAQGK